MMRLVLEKGRRGGLPPSVAYSIGGGENGFIFERSAGTIELEDEETGTTPSAQKAFDALVPFGESGTTWKQWWDASMIESKATFNKARNELLEAGLVDQREQRYFVTSGRGLSRSILGLLDLVDLGEAHKQAQTNGARAQAENTTKMLAAPEVRTVAGLFANPPEWLVRQLEVYRGNPSRHLKPLCAAVAAVVLEDGARASEVQDEVERELEEDPQS
jgi:hypothetical protein